MIDAASAIEPPRTEQVLTGLAVAGACALMLAMMGRAVVVLVIALAASYAIWLTRADWPRSRGVLPVFLVAVLVQGIHLSEEFLSGFYRAFPPVFGAEPWSARRWMAFNIIWIIVFISAAFGIERGWRPAYVLSLFLAIGAGIGNGLGHIALAVRARGYFPGLYTAPIVLAAGVALLLRHRRSLKRVEAAI